MTAVDPFEQAIAGWLGSLEGAEPDDLGERVAGRARAARQRPALVARADLAIARPAAPSLPAGGLASAVILVALAALVAIGLLAGGRVAPTIPAPVPTVAPGPSAALPAPAVAAGSWATVDAPDLDAGGLVAADAFTGRTLVVGDKVRLFDPVDGSWTRIAPPHVGRQTPAVARLLDGSVMLVGGQATTGDPGSPLASAELFSPVAARWVDAGSMATARGSGLTVTTLLDGRVLVAGGTEFAGLPTAELWDPATFAWSPTGTMGDARSGHTATLLRDGRVLVTGGSIVHSSAMASAEIYDPAAGTWTEVAPMSTGRVGHAATLLEDGTVLVSGGHLAISGDGPQAGSERFDPVTGRWSEAGSLAVGRWLHTATLLPDGRVLVAGGRTADGTTATAEVFDPDGGAWTPAAPMTHARSGQVAAGLADGSVLVVGGDPAGGNATAERFVRP